MDAVARVRGVDGAFVDGPGENEAEHLARRTDRPGCDARSGPTGGTKRRTSLGVMETMGFPANVGITWIRSTDS